MKALSTFAQDVVRQATAELHGAVGNPYSDTTLRHLWAAVSNNDADRAADIMATMMAHGMLSEWWDGEFDTAPLAGLTAWLRENTDYTAKTDAVYAMSYDEAARYASTYRRTEGQIRTLLDH